MSMTSSTQLATLAGGCYWCLEAFFQRIKGIQTVKSGYSGGHVDNPTSQQVYTMTTGHAEVVQLTFDPDLITYNEILEIFFVMHDPTTLNRQGPDIGNIYRSVVFYHNKVQEQIARDLIKSFAGKLSSDPVVTQLEAFEKFWPADENSQNFYNNNRNAGYCQVIIDPKIQKLRQKFAQKFIE